MKRITEAETVDYIPLISGDPDLCKKAVAFTLTPCPEPGWEGWENVTYYGSNEMPAYKKHPLEWMYDKWEE